MQVSLLVHGPILAVAPRHPLRGLHHCDRASLLEVRAPQCRRAKGHNERIPEKFTRTHKKHHQTRGPGTCGTQERPIKGHPYSRQRGSYSHYGQRRLPRKAKALLEDQGTYKALKSDPTSRIKSKLISLLKKIKSEGGIDDTQYKKMYPTGAVPPKFYGLPKIHKRGIPLRPIVSSRGSISYEVAKELARILKPLVDSSPHHIKNAGDFIEQIKQVTLQADETITSYDVLALFTSVPIEAAINIIQRRLELDQKIHSRTNMKVEHITSQLEFCLKTTYFQFQGSFYEQINGAAITHQPHSGQPLHGGL